MADTSGVKIDGAAQLRRTLRKAGDDLGDLKAAHARAAAIAAAASAALAPEVSGKLAATIRSAGTKTAGIIRAGNNSKVKYAGPIHWGWRRRHIKAQPFMSDGATSSEGRWLPYYMADVEGIVHKITGA